MCDDVDDEPTLRSPAIRTQTFFTVQRSLILALPVCSTPRGTSVPRE